MRHVCAYIAGIVGTKWRHLTPEDVVRLPRRLVHRYRMYSNERYTVWLTPAVQ